VVIVTIPELGDGLPHRFEVAKEAAMDGLLLERPIEALGHAVGLRLGNKGEALVDSPELDLFQEVVSRVLRAMIHAQLESLAGVGVGCAELGLKPLGNRLQSCKPIADLSDMDADTIGIEMIDGREQLSARV
jgi:hypothetical protein